MPLSDRPAYCTLDAELRFVTANDTLLWVLKTTREQLIGAGLLELYPHARGEALHKALLQAQRTLTPQKGKYFSPLVERWVELEIHPLGDVLQVGFSPTLEEQPGPGPASAGPKES